MEQGTDSKLEKEYIKAIYGHPAYLTYMRNRSWKILGWMKHKQGSRLLGEVLIISGMQIIPLLMTESKEDLKSLLMKEVKEENEKAGLKFNIQKTKIMVFGPISSWQKMGKSGNSDRFYFLVLQNYCGW